MNMMACRMLFAECGLMVIRCIFPVVVLFILSHALKNKKGDR